MRFREVLICLSFLVLQASLEVANFAADLSKCIETKDIDICLRETMDKLRELMPVGIPELGLRRSEPFEIDHLEFNSDPGIVNVKAKFSEVIVRGLSNFVTNHISADLKTSRLALDITLPRMDISGKYNVNGKVFLFRVEGNGDFVSTLHQVTGNGQARIYPSSDNQRLVVKDIAFDFNVGKAQVRMNNLFGGKYNKLAKEVNSFISENSDLIINAVKPQIKREVTVIVERVLNDAFSKVPAKKIIANLDRKSVREGNPSKLNPPLKKAISNPNKPVPFSSSKPSKPVSFTPGSSHSRNRPAPAPHHRYPHPPPPIRGSRKLRFNF